MSSGREAYTEKEKKGNVDVHRHILQFSFRFLEVQLIGDVMP